jgi:hypothetical protein
MKKHPWTLRTTLISKVEETEEGLQDSHKFASIGKFTQMAVIYLPA